MQFIVLFLLIGCLSIATATGIDDVLRTIEYYSENSGLNTIDSNDHELKLADEYLESTVNSVTAKAIFDGKEVAIKIFTNQEQMDREMNAYEALNARIYPRIEQKGVQKVYYTGQIFNRYPVIVMSLFDDNLENIWLDKEQTFSVYSTFQVFLQSVRALKYLQSRGVLHNDIQPRNIFLRGNKVFVGRFDSAALGGGVNDFGSNDFGSRRFWIGENRTAMDDLESLVFTIWHIAGAHSLDQTDNSPAGRTMSQQTEDQNMDFVLEKCEHFVNFSKAQIACEYICVHELLLSDARVPEYKTIITHLKAAVKEIEQMTGQTEFEWLTPTSPSSSSTSSASV